MDRHATSQGDEWLVSGGSITIDQDTGWHELRHVSYGLSRGQIEQMLAALDDPTVPEPDHDWRRTDEPDSIELYWDTGWHELRQVNTFVHRSDLEAMLAALPVS